MIFLLYKRLVTLTQSMYKNSHQLFNSFNNHIADSFLHMHIFFLTALNNTGF